MRRSTCILVKVKHRNRRFFELGAIATGLKVKFWRVYTTGDQLWGITGSA
ncbi:MAG: hypothetical protein ACFCBU_02795 [Cyanophyceae cyanobacterium]